MIDEEAASRSPLRNVLSQAIGGESNIAAEISEVHLANGDCLLLCTDGLTKHLSQHEIVHRVSKETSAVAICESLLGAALEAGGTDNVTVVAGCFRQVPAE